MGNKRGYIMLVHTSRFKRPLISQEAIKERPKAMPHRAFTLPAEALQGTLDYFLNVVDQPITPSSSALPPPLSALHDTTATNHFLDYIEVCNKHGDIWLLNKKAVCMVQLFQSDEKMGAYYKSVFKRENDDLLCR
jgi:hypothetical protein